MSFPKHEDFQVLPIWNSEVIAKVLDQTEVKYIELQLLVQQFFDNSAFSATAKFSKKHIDLAQQIADFSDDTNFSSKMATLINRF